MVALAATLCLSLAGFLSGGSWPNLSLPEVDAGFSWPDVTWPEMPWRRGGKSAPAEGPGSGAGEVSGEFEEANVGSFELVDGIAHRAAEGAVTVFATSEPIASASLAGSACPATQARALALLRDASWNEVTLDEDGDTPYFAYGTQYAGQGKASDPDGHWVSSSLEVEDGRAEGRARHEDYGGFRFDLPLHAPTPPEPSQGQRFDGRVWPGNRVPGTHEAFLAYDAIRRAALAGDLAALLGAQGFTAEQVAAVRALPGIEAELAAHALRFLTTEELSPDDPIQVDQGWAQLVGVGSNSRGEPFFNVYELAACGDALVMVGIYLNPQ